MLHDETRERHCKVIAKTLFADLERKSLAVVAILCSFYAILIVVDLRERVSRIENAEKELVTFFTILSEKGAEVLHRWSLDRCISICLEDRADRIKYIVASCHFCRSEISCSLWNRWFLCHLSIIFVQLANI